MNNAIRQRVLGLAILMAAVGGCSSGAAQQSLKADQASGRMRHQVDETRGRIWVLTPSGVVIVDATSSRPIRSVPLPGWVWAGAPYGCLPDLALGPKGEAVVSSDVVPTLWRIDPATFEVSKHALALNSDADKDIGFARLEYSREQNAYFGVSSFHGSVWRIDALLGHAQKVAQAAPPAPACRSRATPGRGFVSSASRAD